MLEHGGSANATVGHSLSGYATQTPVLMALANSYNRTSSTCLAETINLLLDRGAGGLGTLRQVG